MDLETIKKSREWKQVENGVVVTLPTVEEVNWLIGEVERLARENSSVTDLLKAAHDENEKEQGRWQDAIYKLLGRLAPGADIDGGGCDSGDPLDLTLDEISQGFSHWDNLLFETMDSVSHSYVDTPTFKAAAELITKLHAENEEYAQKVCDECNGDGWVHNRVEGRGACTCMIESEPFQILLKALEKLACLGNGDQFGNSIGNSIALDALRAVLPLDYAGKSPEPV